MEFDIFSISRENKIRITVLCILSLPVDLMLLHDTFLRENPNVKQMELDLKELAEKNKKPQDPEILAADLSSKSQADLDKRSKELAKIRKPPTPEDADRESVDRVLAVDRTDPTEMVRAQNRNADLTNDPNYKIDTETLSAAPTPLPNSDPNMAPQGQAAGTSSAQNPIQIIMPPALQSEIAGQPPLSQKPISPDDPPPNQMLTPFSPPPLSPAEIRSARIAESRSQSLSTFMTWYQAQIEAGPVAGTTGFQTNFNTFTIGNGQMIESEGAYLKAQWALGPRVVTELGYQEIRGRLSGGTSTTLDRNFKSTNLNLGARFRYYSVPEDGMGYYIGLGLDQENTYRYSYFSEISPNVVNRPIQFNHAKIALGAEYRSYFQWRGRLDLSYSRMLSASSKDNIQGFLIDPSSYSKFTLDSSLSHVVSGNWYVGIGFQTSLQKYNFTTPELGETQDGATQTHHFLGRFFLGVEQ